MFNIGKSLKKEQGKEHIKVIISINANTHSYEDKVLISKEWKIFKNIYNERLKKLEELTKTLIMMI